MTPHPNVTYKSIFQKEKKLVSPSGARKQPTQLQKRIYINKRRNKNYWTVVRDKVNIVGV